MDDYKKPKNLRLKKRDMKVTPAVKPSMETSSVVSPKGLKLVKAPVEVRMSDEAPKKKPGKIIRMSRKQSTPSLDAKQSQGYRRVEQEPQTEVMAKEAMKEAMEKARLKRAKKEREMIKRIK